jgi:hypothetical protein
VSVSPDVQSKTAAFALADLITGCVVTQAIYVAAKLKIADVLVDGPLAVPEIAERVGADSGAVYRLLRTLSSHAVFEELPEGRFGLTPMADALRGDATESMRDLAMLMGHPLAWVDWVHLAGSVSSGRASTPQRHLTGGYDFLMSNPEFAVMAGRGMACLSAGETDAVLAAYDFSSFGTIVDVGGGSGGLIAAILQQADNSQGILYDVPFATTEAGAILEKAGVADRCTIQPGSFLERMPAGGDLYVLKHILHDFPEPGFLKILDNVREVLPPDGRILVIEYLLPGNNEQHIGNAIDLWLLLLLGAKERTLPEYSELLATAGFSITRTVSTTAPVSIIEVARG